MELSDSFFSANSSGGVDAAVLSSEAKCRENIDPDREERAGEGDRDAGGEVGKYEEAIDGYDDCGMAGTWTKTSGSSWRIEGREKVEASL